MLRSSSRGSADAAYNYEFAVRAARRAGREPQRARRESRREGAAQAAADESDLPPGPTLHGQPGGPPPASNMNEFKIVMPKRGDERNDAPDAGKGGRRSERDNELGLELPAIRRLDC